MRFLSQISYQHTVTSIKYQHNIVYRRYLDNIEFRRRVCDDLRSIVEIGGLLPHHFPCAVSAAETVVQVGRIWHVKT